MSLESKIRVIAGSFVLISLALGWWVSPWFFLFTAFVGFNLLQSGITGWCLMNDILRKTGLHKDAPAAG
ncbi:MAG: DUF2892 domain-containing protein [Gemmatimonadota bacterium]|jgi:hypothetical protein